MKNTKIYAEILDPKALEQFESAMAQEFAVAGALMPDAHAGYSLPIGAVVATKDYVVPAWVGYDIGCGMCAIKLEGNVTKDDIIPAQKKIFDSIYRRIPVGFNVNKNPEVVYSMAGLTPVGRDIARKKRYLHALGSLGGGNHFIEVGHDKSDEVWIIIHSGSRGVGHAIASHYMTIAGNDREKLGLEFDANNIDFLRFNPDAYPAARERWIDKKIGRLRPKEGHYALSVDSKIGQDYLEDQKWCLEYALSNRKKMLNQVIHAIREGLEDDDIWPEGPIINRNHNHVVWSDVMNAWIHRKGATHAEEGMLGVIPGNMRDGSFIVRGKGNLDSLCSSSHGAGRVLGRKEAQRKLDMSTFRAQMNGIQAKVDESTLDESPSAYKDIHEVMRQQSDLVVVEEHIKPIINIKG